MIVYIGYENGTKQVSFPHWVDAQRIALGQGLAVM
jgi:hypothetical protein